MKNKFLIASNTATLALVVVLFVQLQKKPVNQSHPDARQVARDASNESGDFDNQNDQAGQIAFINDRLANLELKLDYLVMNLQSQAVTSPDLGNQKDRTENDVRSSNEAIRDTEEYIAAETMVNDIIASGVLSAERSNTLSITLQDLGGSTQGLELRKRISAAINNDQLRVEGNAFP